MSAAAADLRLLPCVPNFASIFIAAATSATVQPPKPPSDPNPRYKVGDMVTLTCQLPAGADRIEWTREGGVPLPTRSRQLRNGQVLE